MEFKSVNIDDIPNKKGAKVSCVKEIKNFLKTNFACVEIFPSDGDSLRRIYGFCNRAIERQKLPVKVIVRNGRIFFVRTDMEG